MDEKTQRANALSKKKLERIMNGRKNLYIT